MEVTGYSRESLEAACRAVAPHVHRTPVLRSRLLDTRSGAEVHVKCENFQRGGSYKMRGATHAILKRLEAGPVPAVVTHSSGNFAQALSLAADALGIPAHIVMPESAPAVKKAAVAAYGGIISLCAATLEAREAEAARIRTETGAVFIHPSNDPDVLLGQGTAAAELLEDVPDTDFLLVPVGGGGLLAGTALAARFYAPGCQAIGAEPLEADDAYRSLRSGKIEANASAETVADGLRTVLGNHTFPVIKACVPAIIRVGEVEIVDAMRWVWERMKIVIEPSSAVAFAALFKEPGRFKGRRVGLVVSGGNVDLGNLPF